MENMNAPIGKGAVPSAWLSYIPTILIIVFVVYMIASYFLNKTGDSVVAMGPYELHGSSMVSYPPIQLLDVATGLKSFKNNFTFSTYIYISDTTKPLMTGQQPPNTLITIRGAGSIAVDAQQSTATLTLLPTNPPGQSNPLSTVVIQQFNAARWNQLLFTVEGRTVDVYLNGALVNSTLLDNVPLATPTDVMLNVQSGFDGQLGYTQAWPRRLTLPEVLSNYKRTSDRKGKPYIPDAPFKWSDLLVILEKGMCSVGFCYGNSTDTGPLRYINYQY